MAIKVFVENNDWTVKDMFRKNGFEIIDHIAGAKIVNMIVFTGGADVSPSLYGEENVQSYENPVRDKMCEALFHNYIDVPKVGICRGAQFLNVMSGGAMWQHIANHGQDHNMIDLMTGEKIPVTSTHHQMMIAGESGTVLGIADPKRAANHTSAKTREIPDYDTEVVWYDHTNSFCVQGHPEYGRSETFTDYFFGMINYFWDFKRKEVA